MAFFGLFKAKDKQKSDYTISDLTLEQREDILAMREDGMKPSDIAIELSISASKVCKVLQINKEKLVRRANRDPMDTNIGNPIQDMKVEILKLDLEKKKQQSQWDLEDRKAERQEQLRQYDDEEEEDPPDQDPSTIMMNAFLAKYLAGNTPADPNAPNASPATSPSTAGEATQALIELTDQEILEIFERYPEKIKPLQKLPDSVIQKMIQTQYPQLTQETRDRALGLLKKKKIAN